MFSFTEKNQARGGKCTNFTTHMDYTIFFVNKGHSLIIPINVNKTTVLQLQSIIGKEISLKPNEQILLTAKGSTLDHTKLLSTYKDLGTQSNPIFLFRKSGHDRDEQPQSEINYVFNQIKDCLDQATYVLQYEDPSRIYMELAEKVVDCKKLSQTTLHTCARLVQEHQSLYQGWTALINNLDDSVGKIQKRMTKFQKMMTKVGDMNDRATRLLANFDDVLNQLHKIEIPYDIMTKNASCLNLAQAATISAAPSKMTLYDWISKADPDSKLDEMVNGVEEQISQIKDYNIKTVITAIDSVIEQSTNPEYRDIKGINKRFSQLDYSLEKCEEINKIISELVGKIVTTPKNMDNSKLQIVVDEHKRIFSEIVSVFDRLRQAANVFDQSKQELITNVRTRLAGFIVQSYDRLNFAHLEMIRQEEQTKIIQFRLNLIEQIKESPVIFSQSVSEVIRRSLFRTELESWHSEHSQKCIELTTEEKTMRKRIERKLEKHFLRTLFPGMFDDIPQFFVKSPLGTYDDRIPKIQKEYISLLRQSVPELEQYLKVKLPEISLKLMPRDAKPHPPLGQTKREESFITKEPMNMGVSHYNYSPAQWLSEDGGDSDSPPVTSAMLMARSPDAVMRESQMKPVPIVPSLAQLDILNSVPSTSVARSAPIAIPSSLGNRVLSPLDPLPPMEPPLETMSPMERSEIQSDDQQFSVDDLKNSNASSKLEILIPIKNEVAAVSKGLLDIRADILNSSNKFEEEFKQVNEFLLNQIPEELKNAAEKHKEDIQKLMEQIEKLTADLAESRKQNEEHVESLESQRRLNEEEVSKNSEKADGLEMKIVELEEAVKTAEAETFKKLTIEYELMIDRNRTDYEYQISQKDKEILKLMDQIKKKDAEIQKQEQELQQDKFEDPFSDDYRKTLTAEIRSELEKEFKARTEIITKAHDIKQGDSILRIRKELEVEIKILSQENESKAKKLVKIANERDKLRMIIQKNMEGGEQMLQELDDVLEEIVLSPLRETMPLISLSRSPIPTQTNLQDMEESVFMMQSNMIQSQMMTSTANLPSPQSEPELEVQRSFEKDGRFTTATQTKICLPSMNMMVTIQDIKAGSTVLVIWDEQHKAYILFCSSQYRHFVKESSVRKLGLVLPPDSTSPRRNWCLGRSMKVDNCAIKKSVNRYNLPVGTVVRRVEVDPVGMDMEGDIPTILDPDC